MRFNKNELTSLALQPSSKFDKEGVLIFRELQEGFFKRSEKNDLQNRRKYKNFQELSCYGGSSKANHERWCRLRGNLLFYFKSSDQWSEPVGMLVLQQFSIRTDHHDLDGYYEFCLVFDNGHLQYLATHTDHERNTWVETIQVCNYNALKQKMLQLKELLEKKSATKPEVDIGMWRVRKGHHSLADTGQLPLCEISLSCDNLPCDGNGKPPSSVLSIHVYIPQEDVWVKYACTETIEKSSNPSFLKTVCFWPNDGLTPESHLRVTVMDVKEKFSNLSTPIGTANLPLSALLECQPNKMRFRLVSCKEEVAGFVTITIWRHEREKGVALSTESTPSRAPSRKYKSLAQVPHHRRTQSLPPKLALTQKIPYQGHLRLLFSNALLSTYRFRSGLGGEISAHEIMAESKLSFYLPRLLLDLWMDEEKELLQEVAAMGELVEPWNARQMELLDRHLRILHLYSQAKENLRSHKGACFKMSSQKTDRTLEFAPINLHLQRLWAQNDTLKRNALYDIITVGAFTAHSHKSKNGGLIKLLQSNKGNPCNGASRITSAYDAIQAIKLLRREVVDAMKCLVKLAKQKQCQGMLPICEDMVSKTRILLTLWDPGLVEEALNFIEENKVGTQSAECLSPFRKLTKQLSLAPSKINNGEDFDADLVTPDSPKHRNVWAEISPAILTNRLTRVSESVASDGKFIIFPEAEEESDTERNDNSFSNDDNNNGDLEDVCLNAKPFLDTHAMCISPSANYYKPTDEPEPWDLTQLNIEASMMCLVSKVKLLCGQCCSPAPVRLKKNANSFRMDERCSETRNEESKNTSMIYAIPDRSKSKSGVQSSSPMDDWCDELKPSMKKLRQAMDGLLKTARLTHSVFRLMEDCKSAQRACNIRYRRQVCFSQALTALISGLFARFWCQKPDPTFLYVLSSVGVVAYFEGLLSYYGDEIDMWGDMAIAVEDLNTVTFTLIKCRSVNKEDALPKIIGSRSAIEVLLPVPDTVHAMLPLTTTRTSFRVTSLFFNIGINETATLAESLGMVRPQQRSNIDNFDRLNEYYHRFRKLNSAYVADRIDVKPFQAGAHEASLSDMIEKLSKLVHDTKQKNVEVLHTAQRICRKMKGLRFTSCKSAKDRTGMAVTLEQCDVLQTDFDLAQHEFQSALDCMRSEGTRRENTFKNIGIRKYAFQSIHVFTFPKQYQPPAGTYGTLRT